MQRRYLIAAVLAVILVVATAAGLYFNRPASQASSTEVQVVAAENFWGSLVSQLGGTHTQVLSIVSDRSEEHTSELQSRFDLVCRLLLEKKKIRDYQHPAQPLLQERFCYQLVIDAFSFLPR